MRPSSSSAAALNDDSKLSGHPKEEISGLSTEFGEQISTPCCGSNSSFGFSLGRVTIPRERRSLASRFTASPPCPKSLAGQFVGLHELVGLPPVGKLCAALRASASAAITCGPPVSLAPRATHTKSPLSHRQATMEYMTRTAAVFHDDGIHLPAKVNGASGAPEADSAKLLGGQAHTPKQGGDSAIVHMKDVLLGNDRPPAQRHQYRLIASTVMWSLLMGAVIGMLIESFLEAKVGYGLQHWLLENTGTDVSGHVCKDGLLISGPTKNHLQMLIFTTMLLWSFVGVAIVADIFMVRNLTLTPTLIPTSIPTSTAIPISTLSPNPNPTPTP